MAANTAPIYPLTSQSTVVKTTGTANTARVDPPTSSSVVDGPAAGTNGARVDGVKFVCTVTSVAGLAQVWHKKASDSKYYLIDEIVTPAVTPSTTVAGATVEWTPPAGFKFLPAGDLLAFTMSKAEVWQVAVDQYDY